MSEKDKCACGADVGHVYIEQPGIGGRRGAILSFPREAAPCAAGHALVKVNGLWMREAALD